MNKTTLFLLVISVSLKSCDGSLLNQAKLMLAKRSAPNPIVLDWKQGPGTLIAGQYSGSYDLHHPQIRLFVLQDNFVNLDHCQDFLVHMRDEFMKLSDVEKQDYVKIREAFSKAVEEHATQYEVSAKPEKDFSSIFCQLGSFLFVGATKRIAEWRVTIKTKSGHIETTLPVIKENFECVISGHSYEFQPFFADFNMDYWTKEKNGISGYVAVSTTRTGLR